MKTKKLKKLTLSKTTIINLDSEEQNRVKGGTLGTGIPRCIITAPVQTCDSEAFTCPHTCEESVWP